MQLRNQTVVEPIRLLLLVDNVLLREALCRLLESEPDFLVVAQYGSAGEALEAAGRSRPDVVLLGLDSSAQAGYGFLSSAREAGFGGRILIMTAGMSSEDSLKALQLGACGIFQRGDGLGGLIKALRRVAAGEAWLDQDVIRALADLASVKESGLGASLAEREQQVLRGVMDGLTNKKIGDEIGIPEGAVKAALRRMFQKAGVRTRGQLIRRALDGSFGLRK